MKNLLKITIVVTLFISCTEIPDPLPPDKPFGGGVYIVNEGNFRAGNGSLSFFSYDSLKIYNDLFSSVNGRPLGDVPNSIIGNSDKLYIVVNNSGKIEVLDHLSLVSKATITGLNSPRNIAIIDDNKAYVTSMYSDSVTIINLNDNTIGGYINLRRSSEAILVAEGNAYISNWVAGKEIMVVSTINNKVIDSIEVGVEPESMAIDRYKRLWVLCNGGWDRQSFAELYSINTYTNNVLNKLVFPTKEASPTCLQIDGPGLTLFYLDKGVRMMNVTSDALPGAPLIFESDANFYKIAVNPINSDIFVTDAGDYSQRGYVSCYKNNGAVFSRQQADIIPGSMCFKLRVK